jgi:nucleoside-diphosphate-sugar epimerase
MRILVLGGDGYLGSPQALYLSAAGHDVHIVDNLARRRFDEQHRVDSLVPIANTGRVELEVRLAGIEPAASCSAAMWALAL